MYIYMYIYIYDTFRLLSYDNILYAMHTWMCTMVHNDEDIVVYQGGPNEPGSNGLLWALIGQALLGLPGR